MFSFPDFFILQDIFFFFFSFFFATRDLELVFHVCTGILRRVDPWDTWRRDLTIIASFLLYGTWGAGVRFVVCCKEFMFNVGWLRGNWGGVCGAWRAHRFSFQRWGYCSYSSHHICTGIDDILFFSSLFVTWL